MKIETMILGPIETNCYLVWDENTMHAAVIDPAAAGARIAEKLQSLGLRLSCIFLTHAHFDHVGGVKTLHTLTGAPIYISEADAADPAGMSHGLLQYTDTYQEGDEITVGSLRFRVLETPGHTPGSVCLLCGDTLFSGDTLFCGGCGRTDFPGGSVQQMFASLKKLSQLPAHLAVLPGHGESTVLADELKYNLYMAEAMRR